MIFSEMFFHSVQIIFFVFHNETNMFTFPQNNKEKPQLATLH